jgi:hypothetical protein
LRVTLQENKLIYRDYKWERLMQKEEVSYLEAAC